eukprot:GHVU01027321.1.p2 GENE.GHVU01027321.1~~GHVU01027321.1.p2  ORF type:complete len:155 (+),score=14.57 GHVU01027321.1:125-589(+)
MSNYVRSSGRKATIEIAGRPKGEAQRKGHLQSTSSVLGDSDPSKLPLQIQNAYPPEGFDVGSTALSCNYPPTMTVNQASNYLRWFGPVIRVERAESKGLESNFLIVFGNVESAKALAAAVWNFDEHHTIYSRMADEKPTSWSIVSGWFNSIIGY